MKTLPFIAIWAMATCLLLMSFNCYSPKEQPTSTHSEYLYLKATCRNIDGDYHVYSKVLEVKVQDELMRSQQLQDLLFAFEDELYDNFPQAHFVANHNWVAGGFDDAAIAEANRQEAMSAEKNAVEVVLDGAATVRY